MPDPGGSDAAPSGDPLAALDGTKDWIGGPGPWAGGDGTSDGLPGGGGAGGAGDGADVAALGLPGLGLDAEAGLPLAIWLITTTGGVLLFAVLLRGGGAVVLPSELSALVLDSRRGSGRGGAARHATGAAASHGPATAAAATATPFSSAPATGGRDLAGRPPVTFAAPPARGVERRVIGYRHVRVSSGPDDVRYPEVARLERLDEVEIVAELDGYIQVRLPDGVVGWIHRVAFIGAPPASRLS